MTRSCSTCCPPHGNGAMVCVHAENHGMLCWMGRRLVERGYVRRNTMGPPPADRETEVFTAADHLSRLLDQPIMIFHVSTAEGAGGGAPGARRRRQDFRRDLSAIPVPHGAGHGQAGTGRRQVDVQPARAGRADQEALWQALALGDLQVVSSDHAPYRFDETGKLRAGPWPRSSRSPTACRGWRAACR